GSVNVREALTYDVRPSGAHRSSCTPRERARNESEHEKNAAGSSRDPQTLPYGLRAPNRHSNDAQHERRVDDQSWKILPVHAQYFGIGVAPERLQRRNVPEREQRA